MKKLITGVLVFSSFFAGSVAAERTCATEQCEKARKIPSLRADVKLFLEKRDGCDHFRAEPWSGGDDPEVKWRRDFIFQNIKDLCTGTDIDLEKLRNKYRNDRVMLELLKRYEDRIELK